MQQFTIDPAAIKKLRKQTLIRTLPLLVASAGAGITISAVNPNIKADNVNTLPFIITFAAIAILVGIYRGLAHQKKLLESYTLTIDSNIITRQQYKMPIISLYYNEVSEIVKYSNGSFVIKGK